MKKEYHIEDVFKLDDLETVFRKWVTVDDGVFLYDGVNPYSNLKTLSAEDDFKVRLIPIKQSTGGIRGG